MKTPLMLSLLAMVCGGIVQFFQQIAGANQAYIPSYMVISAFSVCLVGMVFHLLQRHRFELSTAMTWLAILGGILGGIYLLTMLLAFRMGSEGSILFPIAGLGVIVSTVLSFIVFREAITLTKILGIGLGISSIIFLSL